MNHNRVFHISYDPWLHIPVISVHDEGAAVIQPRYYKKPTRSTLNRLNDLTYNPKYAVHVFMGITGVSSVFIRPSSYYRESENIKRVYREVTYGDDAGAI